MKCKEASEITAYLQGEGSEEERAMLRRHHEECESCARELAQFERTLGALGRIETLEPSVGFKNRVQQSFLKAHPQFAPKPRFRLLPAFAAAAAVLLAVAGGIIVFKLRQDADDRRMAHIASPTATDLEIELGTLPKTDLPRKMDASAWEGARSYDRLLLEDLHSLPPWGVGKEFHDAEIWLANHQEPDGSWKGTTAAETLELTGLAVLALDRSHEQGLARRKGVAFLRSRQRDSGAIGGGSPESHAIATLALLEAAIATNDAATIRAAGKGIALIAQQNQDGPWGKGAVAAWHYHVLRLAVASGDRALTPVLVRGHEALSGQKSEGVADLCAVFWTTPAADPTKVPAWMPDRSPLPGTEPANFAKNDLWQAYFGSLLLSPAKSDAWTKWWSPLRAKLLKTQTADGSWPAGLEPGRGQVYVTAVSLLILQTPGRVPTIGD